LLRHHFIIPEDITVTTIDMGSTDNPRLFQSEYPKELKNTSSEAECAMIGELQDATEYKKNITSSHRFCRQPRSKKTFNLTYFFIDDTFNPRGFI
jgi:hypothetical protein